MSDFFRLCVPVVQCCVPESLLHLASRFNVSFLLVRPVYEKLSLRMRLLRSALLNLKQLLFTELATLYLYTTRLCVSSINYTFSAACTILLVLLLSGIISLVPLCNVTMSYYLIVVVTT